MNMLLLGIWGRLLPIPQIIWQRDVRRGSEAARENLSFMTVDHLRVRDFVVLELPRHGAAMSPILIAKSLDLSLERVGIILDELEARLTFLFRNEDGDVAWAFPVTAEPTPHRVLLSSGEQIYAA